MPVHLQREIENLKKDLLTLGAMAEHSVREATLAIEKYDETLARNVIEKDIKIKGGIRKGYSNFKKKNRSLSHRGFPRIPTKRSKNIPRSQ